MTEEYAIKMRELMEKAYACRSKSQAHSRVVRGIIWACVDIFSSFGLNLEIFRGIGHKKQTHYFGTYRVEVFVLLFHRIVDLHNISCSKYCLPMRQHVYTVALDGCICGTLVSQLDGN